MRGIGRGEIKVVHEHVGADVDGVGCLKEREKNMLVVHGMFMGGFNCT